MQKFLTDTVKYFFLFLFLHFQQIYKQLKAHKDHITLKHLISDFASVIRSVGVLFLINMFILFAFIFMPQGKDILFMVSEDIAVGGKIGNFLWLLIGVVLWSIFSEFACRYSIYITDNSGKSLSHNRVEWRKGLQTITANMFLMLPYLILFIGFFANWLSDNTLTDKQKNIGFGVPAIIIYLLLNVVTLFYYKDISINEDSTKDDKSSKDDFYQNIIKAIKKFKPKIIQQFGFTIDELKWRENLFGIYEDFAFIIRKPENFAGAEKKEQDKLCEKFSNAKTNEQIIERNKFPQNKAYIGKGSLVPNDFILREFTNGSIDETYPKKNKPIPINASSTKDEDEYKTEEYYRWVYIIPNKFYRGLHNQLFTFVITSLLIFILISSLRIFTFHKIGSPGLVMLAISCWTGFYIGILYLDYAIFRSRFKTKKPYSNLKNKIFSSIPIRLILLVILFINCFGRKEHNVKYNETGRNDCRPGLVEHFNQWVTKYISDTNNIYWSKKDTSSVYPIVFVCAEGGALRTGAYTSLMLSQIQDKTLKTKGIDFKKSIYAFSGVSGGSLGISFFNSIAYLNNKNDLRYDSLTKTTEKFYTKDFLAPVIADWFFGDLLNNFLPFNIGSFDRARALELSWEDGYNGVINKNAENYLSHDFLTIYKGIHSYPALFINTTEVETGRQCWLSNVKPDTSMFFSTQRDILKYKVRGGINFSTAINFSTRFPFVSPSATLVENPKQIHHYVDGGYVENTGSATMIEVLNALKPVINTINDTLIKKNRKLVPFILVLRFNNDSNNAYKNIIFSNNASEIIDGIVNTRTVNTETALTELNRLTNCNNDEKMKIIGLEVKQSGVPMNWVLSDKSMLNLEIFVTKQCNELLPNLFFLDISKYIHSPNNSKSTPTKTKKHNS